MGSQAGGAKPKSTNPGVEGALDTNPDIYVPEAEQSRLGTMVSPHTPHPHYNQLPLPLPFTIACPRRRCRTRARGHPLPFTKSKESQSQTQATTRSPMSVPMLGRSQQQRGPSKPGLPVNYCGATGAPVSLPSPVPPFSSLRCSSSRRLGTSTPDPCLFSCSLFSDSFLFFSDSFLFF